MGPNNENYKCKAPVSQLLSTKEDKYKSLWTIIFVDTLLCEINVPVGINVPPGKLYKDSKRAPWKT